jgi:hypothetical protein
VAEEIYRWNDLVTYYERRHKEVRAYPGDRVRLTYDLDGTPVPVGNQVVRSAAGNPWLIIAVKVSPADKLRSRSALVANTDLPIGGLSLIMGESALRQSVPLHGLRTDDLEHVLRALTRMAMRLREVSMLEGAEIETPYAYVFH